MKEALLQGLLKASLPGSTGFKQTCWQETLPGVVAVAGDQSVTVRQLKDKYDNVKKDFRLWDLFQDRSGWTYAEDGRALEPADEIDDFFALHEAANPGLSRWRHKGLELKDLCLALMRGTLATGKEASPPPGQVEEQESDELSPASQVESPGRETSSSPSPLSSSPSLSSRSPSAAPEAFILKRKRQVEAMTSRKKSSNPKANKYLGEQLELVNVNMARVAT